MRECWKRLKRARRTWVWIRKAASQPQKLEQAVGSLKKLWRGNR